MSSEDAYASGPYHFAHRQEMLHAYFELLDSNAPTPYLPPSASATSASSTSFHSPFHLYPMLPHMPVSNSGPLSTDSSLANCPIARLDEAVHAAKFAEPIGVWVPTGVIIAVFKRERELTSALRVDSTKGSSRRTWKCSDVDEN
ncbi:unnamed protein product [Schistocephalus solidus]|uniref:PX domain-containing protein n=1 Tax=Schistocephalus solidus TaxID=70667 RepID=A0A183TK68_SCHSO|nr:unnamed protein product [Schistocephalus solidus]